MQTGQNVQVTKTTVYIAETIGESGKQRVAGEAIFEIGRRLKYVKENDLAHGEFGEWVESIGMKHQHANRFMKVVDELVDQNTRRRSI